MQIKVNGELEHIDKSGLTISELLEVKNVESPDMVSVQLNGEIIDRDKYQEQVINESDEIDFLYFMGGGSLS